MAVCVHRNWIAKRAGKPVAEVIHEPRIREIKFRVCRVRVSLRSLIPIDVIFSTQRYLDIPDTRIEAFVQAVPKHKKIALFESDYFAGSLSYML